MASKSCSEITAVGVPTSLFAGKRSVTRGSSKTYVVCSYVFCRAYGNRLRAGAGSIKANEEEEGRREGLHPSGVWNSARRIRRFSGVSECVYVCICTFFIVSVLLCAYLFVSVFTYVYNTDTYRYIHIDSICMYLYVILCICFDPFIFVFICMYLFVSDCNMFGCRAV
jgi:hypothetical protein